MPRMRYILGALLLLGLALTPLTARAAITGTIRGLVKDKATGKPLAGVTVTVTGPALQGEQTEFTDSSGQYIITELPPGADYVVRFYFANIRVERPGVVLSADKTLQVNATIDTNVAKTTTYKIVEKAPTVDVANTQVQTQVTSELVRNTPFGRNFNSVLTLAPGAATDAVGFSFNGATGPENNFLIDGVNTTNPAFGLIGTNLSTEFVKETEIITGGYNAEYGRATGGVVNVITKSGSNEFHGDAWFFYTPFQLDPLRVGRLGEAIVRQTKIRNAFDFGFDLGGPIVKDRVWFYTGFHPQFRTNTINRIVRERTADDVGGYTGTGAYQGDIDTQQQCPPWIDQTLCPGGTFRTTDLTSRRFDQDQRNYQYIGKLNIQLHPNHQLILQYIGTATTNDGALGTIAGSLSQLLRANNTQTHDAKIQFVSKFLDRKLQLDVYAGYHGELAPRARLLQPLDGAAATGVVDQRTVSLSIYETDLTNCAVRRVTGQNGQTVNFNPCPVANYVFGGIGFNADTRNHRAVATLGLTYFLHAAGTHGIKFGFDFEDNVYTDNRFYTGLGRYDIRTANRVRRIQFGRRVTDPATGAQSVVLQDGNNGEPNGFNATTNTYNESFYLRDSWNVGFVPGLTINGGVRWELQQVRDVNRDTQISIVDNVAPRVGVIYDFSRKGLGKFFASYGRFYESIPLDLNDRQFSGEGLAIQNRRYDLPYVAGTPGAGAGAGCPAGPTGLVDISQCRFDTPPPSELNGGEIGAVSPVLRGQFQNQFVAGIQYDVGWDVVLGASYVFQNLGRIIEDISPDGGANYIIANPGDPTDQNAVRRLQDDIRNLQRQIDAATDPNVRAELLDRKNQQVQTLGLYQGVATFPKPRRDYHALIVTVTKRFSKNFQVLASYTYSRTFGNYPGLFQASNGQLDPNISSQYDLRELLVNRDGPLPNDRPHNVKITPSYTVPFRSGGLTFGVNFGAQSGTPIEVLAQHPIYGRRESYLLPRGAGGRTPFTTFFDLHLAYYHQFSKLIRLELIWDIFNLFNQQKATAVDAEYTTDIVLPVQNGRSSDLARVRNSQGNPININPNFGQPTAYQAPLSMRFGVRLSF